MNASFALQQLSGFLCGWKARKKLISLMNGWVNLKHDLGSFIKPKDRKPFASIESITYYATLGSGILLFVGTGIYLASLGTRLPTHADRTLEALTISSVFGYMYIAENLKDAVMVLMFYELRNNFRQVIDILPITMTSRWT